MNILWWLLWWVIFRVSQFLGSNVRLLFTIYTYDKTETEGIGKDGRKARDNESSQKEELKLAVTDFIVIQKENYQYLNPRDVIDFP
jgi:hypothetical protein